MSLNALGFYQRTFSSICIEHTTKLKFQTCKPHALMLLLCNCEWWHFADTLPEYLISSRGQVSQDSSVKLLLNHFDKLLNNGSPG